MPEYVNAGSYTAYFVVNKTNYNPYYGSIVTTITPKELSEEMVGNIAAVVYTGSQLTPEITVTDGEPSIITPDDYTVSYGENINVATGGTVTLTGKNNYTGTVSKSFEILKADMTVTSENYNGVYDGTAHKAVVTVTKPENAAVVYGTAEGTYDINEMPEYINAGTYTVYYKAVDPNYNDYTGSVTVTISPKTVTETMIGDIADVYYTGSQITPDITVTDNGIITENDYTVGYGENINVATGGTVTITGQGNYTGIASKHFVIKKAPLNVSAKSKTVVYGDEIKIDISYSGFVNNETTEVIKSPAVVSGFDVLPSVGQYKIVLNGADADNYEMVYDENAVLTVDKKDISIYELKVLDKDYDGNINAVVDSSSVVFEGLLENADVKIDTEAVKAEFASYEVGENISVAVTGLAIIGDSANNYNLITTEFDTSASILAVENAAYIASQIKELTVEKNAVAVILPEVPEGYNVKIKSSSDKGIVGLDGKITPDGNERTVDLILTVYNQDESDAADTAVITATIPAATVLDVEVLATEGGTVTENGPYFKNSEATFTAVADEGYGFAGWYSGDELLSTDSSYIVTVTENISFTAKFEKLIETSTETSTEVSTEISTQTGTETSTETTTVAHKSNGGGGGGGSVSAAYSVKFDTNGGTRIKTVSLTKNKVLKEPEAPVKDGYVFDGWYSDSMFENKYDFNTKVTGSITLYAKWIKNEDITEETPESVDEKTEYDLTKSQIIMTIDSYDVSIFGEIVRNDVVPKIVNERTMLPIRIIAEALDASVDWNGAEKKVTINKNDGTEIVVLINYEKAYVDNKEITLDSAAFIENNRTYLPVRFVAEGLGSKVDWNSNTKQVVITK